MPLHIKLKFGKKIRINFSLENKKDLKKQTIGAIKKLSQLKRYQFLVSW